MKLKFKCFLIFFIFTKLSNIKTATSNILNEAKELIINLPGKNNMFGAAPMISYLIQIYGMYKVSNFILNATGYPKKKNKFSANPIYNTLRYSSNIGIIYLLASLAPYGNNEIKKIWKNLIFNQKD